MILVALVFCKHTLLVLLGIKRSIQYFRQRRQVRHGRREELLATETVAGNNTSHNVRLDGCVGSIAEVFRCLFGVVDCPPGFIRDMSTGCSIANYTQYLYQYITIYQRKLTTY